MPLKIAGPSAHKSHSTVSIHGNTPGRPRHMTISLAYLVISYFLPFFRACPSGTHCDAFGGTDDAPHM